MQSSIRRTVGMLALLTLSSAGTQSPAVPDTIEGHLAAGKSAAGGRDNTPDFYGLVTALCVAPQRGAPPLDAPAPREDPDRKATYMQPKKAFDDLYWMGTESVSAWLLTSSDGYILYDTANVYDAEDLLIGGMQKLGLDPAKVKYVIVSHGHRGESGGAYLFQSRYGAHIVTGDWDLIEGSLHGYPTGKPKRDIVATDGMTITLGNRTVTLYATPGHTPGTISGIFQVHDRGKPLTAVYSGGTEFNFPNDVAHFDQYLASERRLAALASAAGATVIINNQSEFNGAADKLRMLADRRPGERHPLDVGARAVARYFKIEDECAQAQRLKIMAEPARGG
ncbi:MBL fold metallo-hydrolase [Bradyrhizobium sp. Tv2a-2]|uniref:MBL fold metallo-hydrolase n=1 Tax=Bradyrhizobium sp. Tv2a-2 TaxID=113395 RepID=UPI0003FC328A|nr:MBL fold metallo-hydrolase [Bradyrhizobium sp. Tv2a-2]